MTLSPNTSTSFHKLNTSPCCSAPTAVSKEPNSGYGAARHHVQHMLCEPRYTLQQGRVNCRTGLRSVSGPAGLSLCPESSQLLDTQPHPTAFPHQSPGHCSNIGSLDQNREGKNTNRFPNNISHQAPRPSRAKAVATSFCKRYSKKSWRLLLSPSPGPWPHTKWAAHRTVGRSD